MAFLKLPMFGGLNIEDWYRQVWQMLNRRVAGVYTPTTSNTANITTITANEVMWMRIDDIVHVAGEIYVDPTAIGSVTYRMTLPINSNFTQTYNAAGVIVMSQGSTRDEVGQIEAVVGTSQVMAQYYASVSTPDTMHFTFTYKVV